MDPVARHLAEAAGAGCTVELGDARALTARSGSYDTVLLLGPLYHLVAEADRMTALSEAYRVVRPGGLVAAAAISRYASLFEHTALAHLDDSPLQEVVGRILATGEHDGVRGFTEAYFHSGEQLRRELRRAGFKDTRVYGIEGPAWALVKAVEHHTGETLRDSRLFDSVLAAARMAELHPELLAASSHLPAVGRR